MVHFCVKFLISISFRVYFIIDNKTIYPLSYKIENNQYITRILQRNNGKECVGLLNCLLAIGRSILLQFLDYSPHNLRRIGIIISANMVYMCGRLCSGICWLFVIYHNKSFCRRLNFTGPFTGSFF